jgi:hypothetical protein
MSAFCSAEPGPELLRLADQDISVSVAASSLRSFSSLSCGNVSVVQLTGNLAIAILRLTGHASIAAALRHHARRPSRPLQTIMNC